MSDAVQEILARIGQLSDDDRTAFEEQLSKRHDAIDRAVEAIRSSDWKVLLQAQPRN